MLLEYLSRHSFLKRGEQQCLLRMLSVGFRAGKICSHSWDLRLGYTPNLPITSKTWLDSWEAIKEMEIYFPFQLVTTHRAQVLSFLYPFAILAETRWNCPVCSSNVYLAFTFKSSSKSKSLPAPKTPSGAQHFTYNTSTLIKNIKFIYWGRGCMPLHMCGGQKTNLQYCFFPHLYGS